MNETSAKLRLNAQIFMESSDESIVLLRFTSAQKLTCLLTRTTLFTVSERGLSFLTSRKFDLYAFC